MKPIEEKELAIAQLNQAIHTALATYSNVHRGSGFNSQVTTQLYEQARAVVLEVLGLSRHTYKVVFCSPRRAEMITSQLPSKKYKMLSSKEIGLALGVRAIAIKKGSLSKEAPFDTGGGTARLISTEWVIWSKAPDRFEAGTPAIINVIAFAKALLLAKQFGKNIFKNSIRERGQSLDILHADAFTDMHGKALLDEVRKSLIGSQMMVPSTSDERPFVNLDNSASTPTFGPIWEVFRQVVYEKGSDPMEMIEEVKNICVRMLGAPSLEYDILFTTNTTEAINLVAESVAMESKGSSQTVVVNTLLEHSSNDLPWRMIPNTTLIRLGVDADGFIDLQELEALLRSYNEAEEHGEKRIRLVTISGASNVLGSCNDLPEISRIVHAYDARLLVDAAQLIAHRKVEMKSWDIDYLAFSGHKVYAPFGSGALVARKGLLHFQEQEIERIRWSGEENVAGIAALGKALELLERVSMDIIEEEERELTVYLLHSLSNISGLKVYGIRSEDHPRFSERLGVVALALKGIMADEIAKKLKLQGGMGVRYGCHCSHIIVKHILGVSPGLEKFQKRMITLLPKVQLPGVLRVSLGIQNTRDDVDRLVQTLETIRKKGTNHSTETGSEGEKLSFSRVRKASKSKVKGIIYKIYP